MANFDFSKQISKLTVDGIMAAISAAAPFLLLFLAIGTFIAVGVFQADFYRHIFTARFTANAGAMAVFVSVIHQAVRFGLLIASMRDFSDSRPWNGWLGLIGSVALVWYDVKVAGWLAAVWASNGLAEVYIYQSTVVFLIMLGLLLEFRLILTVDGASFGAPKQRATTASTSMGNGQTAAGQYAATGNGNGHY